MSLKSWMVANLDREPRPPRRLGLGENRAKDGKRDDLQHSKVPILFHLLTGGLLPQAFQAASMVVRKHTRVPWQRQQISPILAP